MRNERRFELLVCSNRRRSACHFRAAALFAGRDPRVLEAKLELK